jgi:hypothetical protein
MRVDEESVHAAYLAALTALDAGLTVKPERAIRRGRNTCYDLGEGKRTETILDNTRQRFDGGHASVDAAMAEKIVKACGDSGLLDLYKSQGGSTTDPGLAGLLVGGSP